MKSSPFLKILAASPLLLALPASAAIVYEGFEYTAGDGLHGKSGGQGWDASSSWDVPISADRDNSVIVTGGLSYSSGSVSISGGSTALQLGGGTSAGQKLLGGRELTATSADEVYFSYLMKLNGSTGNDDFTARLGFDTEMESSGQTGYNTSQRPIGSLRNSSNGNTSPLGSAAGGSGSDFTDGTTYFLVAKMYSSGTNGNFDRMDFYVNPDSNVTPGGTYFSATGLELDTGTSALGAFSLWAGNMTSASELLLIDELRVTTSWSEAVTAVPEPATVGMLIGALGVLLIAVRRRPR